MERYMYQDDSFEKMLKQKSDEYRMYPSNQTWEKIQKQVQKKNSILNFKSTGLTIVLLSAFSLYISNNQGANNKTAFIAIQEITEQPLEVILQSPAAIIKAKNTTQSNSSSVTATAENNSEDLLPITIEKANAPVLFISEPTQEELKSIAPVTPNVDEKTAEEFLIEKSSNSKLLSSLKPVLSDLIPEQKIPILTIEKNTEVPEESPELKTDAELNYEVNIPVITKPVKVRQLQIYITPSASYRVLSADHKFTFGNFPQQDPENAITNTPSLGLEAGVAMLFPIAKNLKFRTGIQFNYTRYTVNAFKATPQLTTVRLNYSSIQRVSTLNNDYGFFTKDVANETYQVSIPLGVEVRLIGKKKVQWNIAANVQPTYLIKASGYLLTNDFKNYIKAPDLLSHLNLNSALETFISWDIKKIKLQAGPQIRYQLFSNNRNIYPISEHLIDYGFRIGIVKTLR